MKKLALICLIGGLAKAWAASTINPVNKLAGGANIGWLNAAGDVANGAVIGEYVCSGYTWSANCDWIHLGGGTPVNAIRYQNNSATDFGVNHDGQGNLRGFAYGANIGWINFENTGAPRVDLKTGRLSGSAWSANCGWIGLSNAFAHVQTDTLRMGADSDGDGITDAWELTYTNTLARFTASTDTDRDGMSDLKEHIADTNPLDPNDYLRITDNSTLFGGGDETNTLTWTTKPTRCYPLDYRTNLHAVTPWVNATAVFAPGSGMKTTQMLTLSPPLAERYFRIEAIKPLSP